MFQEKAWTPPAQNPPRGGRGWLQVLLTGIVLFVAATLIMFLTGNPNLYPTVILVGNFLVPVAFVAFLYDHQHLSALTPETNIQMTTSLPALYRVPSSLAWF